MTPFAPPAEPPALIYYEESVSESSARTRADQTLNFGSALLYEDVTVAVGAAKQQALIADGSVVYSNKIIPMRAPDPSLKKKFRTERMSRLDREYRW